MKKTILIISLIIFISLCFVFNKYDLDISIFLTKYDNSFYEFLQKKNAADGKIRRRLNFYSFNPKISSADTSNILQILAKVSMDGNLSNRIYLLTVEGFTPSFSANSF